MHCETIRSDLSGYLDGELTGDEVRRVETHLADCIKCRIAYEQLRSQSIMLHDWSTNILVPTELPQLLVERVADFHRLSQARRLAGIYAICTCVITCGMGLVFAIVFGRFIRAMTKLSLATTHSLLMFASTLGSNWLVLGVASCLIVGGCSIVGVIRILRSSEVIA